MEILARKFKFEFKTLVYFYTLVGANVDRKTVEGKYHDWRELFDNLLFLSIHLFIKKFIILISYLALASFTKILVILCQFLDQKILLKTFLQIFHSLHLNHNILKTLFPAFDCCALETLDLILINTPKK